MKILMLVLYGISALGMVAAFIFTILDIKKYAIALKEAGKKFRKPSKVENFANWVKILLCVFCPIVNTIIFIAVMFSAKDLAIGAMHSIDDNILIGEEK